MKPILLDCFSGAGGCARGYQQAGFYVVGIDNRPQPRYAGDEFYKADALAVLDFLLRGNEWQGYVLEDFAGFHASPPCHAYSVLRHAAEQKGRDKADLVGATRIALKSSGLPYVIENVPGAPLYHSIELCGSMFGLRAGHRQLRRHRLFECSFPILQPSCQHIGEAIGVYGGGPTGRYTFGNGAKKDYYNRRGGYQGTVAEKYEAMGVDWMNGAEINQAIPPAYTAFIGDYLLSEVNARQRAAA